MILISGGSGFLGGSVAQAIPQQDRLLLARQPAEDSLQVDLTDHESIQQLIEQLASKNIDGFLHCAAVTPWSGNTDFSQDVKMAAGVKAICENLKIPKLVFISGWVVYDKDAEPPYVEDNTRLAPADDYGRSKLNVKEYFLDKLRGTTVINLRTASIYGPGQTSSGLIPNLSKSALQTGVMQVGAKNTRRDYLFVDDFVQAVLRVLSADFGQNTNLNIGSGTSVPVEAVAGVIKTAAEKLTNQNVAIRFNDEITEAVPPDNRLSIDKARRMGIITDTTSFNDGIARYLEWLHENNI